jgi:hypothetical protein
MNKKVNALNPELSIGDKIMLLHMDGETSVPMGSIGMVTEINIDPFEKDSKIISVSWDNGSSLAIISSTDAWKKVKE